MLMNFLFCRLSTLSCRQWLTAVEAAAEDGTGIGTEGVAEAAVDRSSAEATSAEEVVVAAVAAAVINDSMNTRFIRPII